MKYFVLLISILFFSSNYALSEEKADCSDLKKFSLQHTWCKSENTGKSIKNKLGSLNKNNTSKDSKN